ncbi:hypothetical protein LSAT2_010837 [Lamellibrachia satsuma]|nr:hypothetical protein LSAT2_010837 [Lamellibrachia satsuma]
MVQQSAYERQTIQPNYIQSWRSRKHRTIYTFMAFSVINFLLGLAMIGIGLYEYPDDAKLMTFSRLPPPVGQRSSDTLSTMSLLGYGRVVVTSLGAIACVKGILGVLVAVKHVKYLLITYAIVLSVVIIGQVVVMSMCLNYVKRVDTNLENMMKLTIHDAYAGATINRNHRIIQTYDPFSMAWDMVMTRYECCGATSHTDFAKNATRWNRALFFRDTIVRAHVPLVCCKMEKYWAYPHDMGNVKFVNLGKCMKHGDERYINTKPCLKSYRFPVTWLHRVYESPSLHQHKALSKVGMCGSLGFPSLGSTVCMNHLVYINTKPCLKSVSSMIRDYTNIHVAFAVANTLVDICCTALAVYLFQMLRHRLLRAMAFRDEKRRLFTMMADLSESLLYPNTTPTTRVDTSRTDLNPTSLMVYPQSAALVAIKCRATIKGKTTMPFPMAGVKGKPRRYSYRM